MAAKIKSENILLVYSVGVFESDKLVTFILLGYDEIQGVRNIYNAGTGVIPSFRNRGITKALYQYIGIYAYVLEVIEGDVKALTGYEKLSFKTVETAGHLKVRLFHGCKQDLNKNDRQTNMEGGQSFMDFGPSWQKRLSFH